MLIVTLLSIGAFLAGRVKGSPEENSFLAAKPIFQQLAGILPNATPTPDQCLTLCDRANDKFTSCQFASDIGDCVCGSSIIYRPLQDCVDCIAETPAGSDAAVMNSTEGLIQAANDLCDLAGMPPVIHDPFNNGTSTSSSPSAATTSTGLDQDSSIPDGTSFPAAAATPSSNPGSNGRGGPLANQPTTSGPGILRSGAISLSSQGFQVIFLFCLGMAFWTLQL